MLGVNSVIGNNFNLEVDLCDIHVYELERYQAEEFQVSGLSYHLIKHVFDYFLPTQFTFSIHLFFKSNQNYFSIGSDTDVSILGYNSVLS
jgi:predicted component of type VI protein secretion system